MMKYYAVILFLVLLSHHQPSAGGTGDEALVRILAERSTDFAAQARERAGADGPLAFKYFSGLVVDEIRAAGDGPAADGLARALSGQLDSSSPGRLGHLLHVYAREFYRERIIAATSRMITFRTYATDVPNRLNPEFIRQKEFLGALADTLGLGFRDVDGYVQEIWIGEGGEPFGLMVHSDVQPVEEKAWRSDPWSGKVTDSLIGGRGAIDDKGALAAIMYGMRAILDCGLPLRNKLVLLVGTDEESANEDITTYLATNAPPARTVVVDYAYPVYTAEKGWCGLWLKAARGPGTLRDGMNLVDVQGGYSPSIVPGNATATIRAVGVTPAEALARLRVLAAGFNEARAGAGIGVETKGGDILVTATGRSVHASVPETGHNALMDLLVWLDRDVRPVDNPVRLMAGFAARNIGLELDGAALGIAHRDSFMGDVTVAANMFVCDPDSVLFMFNFRVPRGVDLAAIGRTIESRVDGFTAGTGLGVSRQSYFSEALYNDPKSPFVRRLLDIYEDVTGVRTTARSMGGGTYARRIPNAVVFGPCLDGDEYLGHQPDESITLGALTRNIELLTHTMVRFGFE